MSGGIHLTFEKRERLAALRAEGLSLRTIAARLGRAALFDPGPSLTSTWTDPAREGQRRGPGQCYGRPGPATKPARMQT
jgi:hypothetical protein